MNADMNDRELAPRPLRRTRSPRSAGRAAAALAAATLLGTSACDSRPNPVATSHVAVDPPGTGVVFSYPGNGQYDVPLGARILLGFSDPVAASVDTACASAGGQVTGTFCVEGPDGFVAGAATVDGRTLAFTPGAALAAGVTYKVWARPALLAGATNLPTQTPLLTFRTRSTRVRAGEAATVLTVNGVPLAADGTVPLPFLDAAPIRLLFSEPIDPTTVDAASVRLVHAADGAAVEGVVVAHGIHLTFQPAATLTPGDAYRLELGPAVHDLGGEAIAPVAIAFTPRRMAAAGHGLFPLSLDVAPAWNDVQQPGSRLGQMPVNANVVSSQLIGTNTLGVVAGGLDTLAGDPQVMGTPLPMLIRRGQRLDLTSMQIRYGGALESGLQTGTMHFTMLTDALGYMLRNPYRAADQEPDDAQAPTWVDFTMDAVMASEDGHGNTISTQTVMGVRVLGISTLDGDQLAIEQVGAIDFDLLGVDTAPVALALRFRTGPRTATPELGLPFLVSSYPGDAARDVPPADPLELNFSGPLDPTRVRDGVDVTLAQGGTPIPASIRLEGATVVIVPSRRLAEGASFTLSWSGLRSLGGADVPGGTLSFTTASSASDREVPPIVTALVPGAPCALEGATGATPGRCAGAQTSDGGYQPFTLPANRDVRVVFSQPMDPATFTLGTACAQGSVRVERLDANGRCAGVVAGSLVKRDREIRFLATDPWVAGAAYRLTLVAGANGTCEAGDICSRNALPLNTDPLTAARPGYGGGPDLVVDFKGAPPTLDTYQPLASDPVADQNGNGYLDATEQANDRNRVAMEIARFGGIVTSASLPGTDCLPARDGQQVCSYLNATLPSSIGGVLASCPIDAQGNASTAQNPCVRVQVFPSAIIGTSIEMSTTALGLIPIANLPTGMQLMRLREIDGPIYGYILREPGVADPQFVINQDIYFDAPDLAIPVATHDLHGKPLHFTLKGPVTFRADGRMDVSLRNIADVPLQVNISALFLPGNIDLLIPAGEMRITLAGPPLR